MTDGVIACSEELYLTDANDVLTKIVGLQSVSLPSFSVSEVDITTQDDACVTKTRAGLIDLGSMTATILHIPNSATDTLILEHLFSKETRPGKIVVSDGATGTIDVSVNAFIMNYEQGGETNSGEKRESTVTLRLTSKPTQAATA